MERWPGFTQWLTETWASHPLRGKGGVWRLREVLVSPAAAAAFALPHPEWFTAVAGGGVRVAVAPVASDSDVRLVCVPASGARAPVRTAQVPLTVGLSTDEAIAYVGLRGHGLSPAEALAATHAVLS